MPTYTELTDTVAEQLTTSLKQLQELQVSLLTPVVRTTAGLVPDVDVPFADRLPSQKDVVEASFGLAERTLEAQRGYVVGLVDAVATASESGRKTAAKPAAAKK